MHRSAWSARASDGASPAKDSAPHWGKRPRAMFTSTSQVNKLQTPKTAVLWLLSAVYRTGLTRRFYAFFSPHCTDFAAKMKTLVLFINTKLHVLTQTGAAAFTLFLHLHALHELEHTDAFCCSLRFILNTVARNVTSPQTNVLLVSRHFSPSNGFGYVPIGFEIIQLCDLNSKGRDLAWLTCRRCSCSLSVGRKGRTLNRNELYSHFSSETEDQRPSLFHSLF